MLTDRDGSALSRNWPSSISTSAPVAPPKGELGSFLASDSNFAPIAPAAPCTADPTLAVVHDPPCAGARGNLVSPSSELTCSGRRPRYSAAMMVIIVYVPGPMSLLAVV